MVVVGKSSYVPGAAEEVYRSPVGQRRSVITGASADNQRTHPHGLSPRKGLYSARSRYRRNNLGWPGQFIFQSLSAATWESRQCAFELYTSSDEDAGSSSCARFIKDVYPPEPQASY